MTTIPSADIASTPSEIARPKLDHPMGIRTILIFFAIMALGLFFTAYSIHKDLTAASTPVTSYLPFLLLGLRHRARLRIRQRFPQHRQYGRNRDLQPLAGSADRASNSWNGVRT